MNENLDLTKILDGCPEGTEFYSTVYGKVSFVGIRPNKDYPIKIKLKCNPEGAITAIAKDGRIRISCDGECTLFPSKDQRDWSKFERFWDKPKVDKFDPKTFQPFDKVLARDYGNDTWNACLFSHPAAELDNNWYVCDNTYWHFIIPYNDETKHLVGTKDDCPEYYKWWGE